LDTSAQFDAVTNSCKSVYLKKVKDYGSSWRVLRTISIVDQLYIKAWRIRQIQEKKSQLIADSIESEFMAIVNYGLIALIQFELNDNEARMELSESEADQFYTDQLILVKALMMQKNHDYGEAWRAMSQESFVDLILTKLARIKQILANDGQTLISEGIDANLHDIINYAVFALIRMRY